MAALLIPHLTEKTYGLATQLNVYVFKVAKHLNKVQIKNLLQAEYKVEVIKLKTLVAKGKTVQRYHKNYNRSILGRRSTFKKAYVSLKKGDKIAVFTDFQSADKQDKNSQVAPS